MTSDVSVVLGTFNGERYIEEQLASILAQTLPPVEVIVADDGSTDRTLEIVEAVSARSDVPLRIIRNVRRLGFADNFLNAASTARGALVAFSDQDDRWSADKLAVSAAALERYGAVYCTHAVALMDEQGTDLGRTAQAVPRDVLTPPRSSDPWDARYGFSVLIRRSLLDLIPAESRGPDTFAPDTALSHDRWAYSLAWSVGRSVHLSAELAVYRQHSAQLYGGPVRRTYRMRVAHKLANCEERVAFLARIAHLRADLFRAAGPSSETADAAAAWARLHLLYRRRSLLYTETRPVHRAARLLQLVGTGAFRRFDRQGVGLRALVEDVVLGLAGPRLRRRFATR